MNDHRHEACDIYGTAATRSDIDQLESTAAGLREDLAAAEARIGEHDDELRDIRARLGRP